jgi:hypothetical protein
MSERHFSHEARPFGCLLALALACGAAACGGDSSSGGSPSAPSGTPTTSAVSVTLKSPIRMGELAQASGSATLTNGQSQNLTTGWRSDNVGIATVTDAGAVNGVANGQANIYVESGGRRGQQTVRVVPDYQGEWEGTIRLASCTQTGIIATAGFCSEIGSVGSVEGFDLTVTQTGEALSVVIYFAEDSRTVATSIAPDGSVAATGNFSFSDEGITLTADSEWRLNSTLVGALTGTVTDVFRIAGFSGEGRVVYDILTATRGTSSVRSHGSRDRRALTRGLGRRLVR